jgi:DNA-binding transcriptional regulator LsrR (DeoR family)
MAQEFTPEQVVEAANSLDQDEFTRADIAGQLGVEKSDVKQAFNKARKQDLIEKTRDDDENTGHFKVAG